MVQPQIALLATKLTVPPPRPFQVARKLLWEKQWMTAGLRLILVSAPAGFGKSTYIAQGCHALKAQQVGVAWYALDSSDNDPQHFAAYLLGAFSTADCAQAATWTALKQQAGTGLEQVIIQLINVLAQTSQPYVLVLDDYHCITTQAVHHAVGLLLERLPDDVRVVIGSRADPPLQLSRLRACQQMLEIRAHDLRFNTAEVATFFQNARQLTLSPHSARLLEDATEGWAAGLQLAALSLGAQVNDAAINAFAARFSGSQRDIFDYLADEVFAQQPAELQTFLLQTSVLQRLHADLCGSVTASAGAPLLLEEVERANLFLIPLDHERRWYRYHHLFTDFLRARLERDHPGQAADLHRRASAWYWQQGLMVEAVNHALAAKDYALAAGMLQDAAYPMLLEQGAYATLLAYAEQMPRAFIESRPRICLPIARALWVAGRRKESDQLLLSAEQALERLPQQSAETQELKALLLTARAIDAALDGEVQVSLKLAEQALGYMPPNAPDIYGRILFAMGYSYRSMGELERAEQTYTRAVETLRPTNKHTLFWPCVGDLGLVYYARGQISRAAALCRAEIASGRPQVPIAGHVYYALGQALYEQNALDEAEVALRRGHDLLVSGSVFSHVWFGPLLLARIAQARGHEQSADEWLHQAASYAERYHQPYVMGWVAAYRALRALALHETKAAFEWAHHYQQQPRRDVLQEIEDTILVRVYLAENRAEEALLLAALPLATARTLGHISTLLQLLVLQALALDALGRPDSALRALGEALQLGEQHGFVRLFVDEGAPLFHLLRRVLAQHGTHADYVRTLLHAAGIDTAQGSDGYAHEVLTERELDVMRLLANGASNQDIADRLVITLGTAKSHISHIMNKLNARNRTEAVAHARALKLVED
ncbi:MAG: hypothetical protein HXY40_00450 [Chloroflexi bacterium]|nr:hypothetical protein [Chloroflexota bacterium]